MKVLMFGWELPPHNSGGLGVACLGLTRALSRLGVDVTFVLPKKLGAYDGSARVVFADDYTKQMGISQVIEVDSPLSPYITSDSYEEVIAGAPKNIYARNLFQEVKRYGLIARAIAAREQFDVIHAHDWLSFEAGMAAKRVSGKPLVVHVHATEFDRGGGMGVNSQVYEIEKRGMEAADKVITVSQWTKDIVMEKYGIPGDKISVVHNGIDESDFIRPHGLPKEILRLKEEGSKIVLFLGRITIQKGPDYFVRMAKRVLEYVPDTYFVVSGSGDMERQMIEEAVGLGMGDRFIFTGFLRGEENSMMYAAADLFVMPSVSEPFGITPLEAGMTGTPVIMSKQSGVSEVMSHALKCDFWDIDEMANKAISVLSFPALHKDLSINVYSETRSVNWGRAAEKCILVYNALA